MTAPSDYDLSLAETRVLGALLEKEMATPEYYPMTRNSLLAACNQKTARDPVTDLDEDEVDAALGSLREQGLAALVATAGGRTAKFRHRIDDAFTLEPGEKAILCVLLLRGPQTIGELRTRTERLHRFDSLEDVSETLQELMGDQGHPPLAVALPRTPGRKEIRHAHRLSDPASSPATNSPEEPSSDDAPAPGGHGKRIAELEQRVQELESRLNVLQSAFDEWQRQFD